MKGGNTMANVFDVAKYILEKKGTMSTMKLQKLCYYAQAWSLVWDDAPLFDEEFEAWANGPVCRELFFKTQGQFSVSAADETGGEDNLTDNEAYTKICPSVAYIILSCTNILSVYTLTFPRLLVT